MSIKRPCVSSAPGEEAGIALEMKRTITAQLQPNTAVLSLFGVGWAEL